jgi:CDP-diacylglycerol--glycerol-3-phosphate 3-phosphatidyltransferase
MKCSMIRGQWTISNLISLSRILLLVPISLLLLQNNPSQRWLILTLVVIAAMTDLVDGMLARRFNQITELGKIIDPIADKTCIAVIGLILMLQNKIPIWFFIAALLRDLLILLGGLYLSRGKNIVLPSNKVGKWAAGIVTLYLVLAFISFESLSEVTSVFLILSTLLLIISFVLYLIRSIKVLRVNGNNA